MMLYRKNDAPLDFDFAKVTEQSQDNPVFYVQYAHARATRSSATRGPRCSRNCRGYRQRSRVARQVGAGTAVGPGRTELLKRLAIFPRMLEAAAAAHEPHRIAFYLYDLASEFHALWTKGRDLPYLRFIINNDADLTKARLAMVQGVVSVLASGLAILGVHAPDEMR